MVDIDQASNEGDSISRERPVETKRRNPLLIDEATREGSDRKRQKVEISARGERMPSATKSNQAFDFSRWFGRRSQKVDSDQAITESGPVSRKRYAEMQQREDRIKNEAENVGSDRRRKQAKVSAGSKLATHGDLGPLGIPELPGESLNRSVEILGPLGIPELAGEELDRPVETFSQSAKPEIAGADLESTPVENTMPFESATDVHTSIPSFAEESSSAIPEFGTELSGLRRLEIPSFDQA